MSQEEWRQPNLNPEPYAFRVRADGTVGCRECGDSGWVEVNSSLTGIPTVRPCSRCCPRVFQRWVEGFPREESRRGGVPEFTRESPPAPGPVAAPEQQEAF